MNRQRLAAVPPLTVVTRRSVSLAGGGASGSDAARFQPEPAACEYLDIGRGNGFLLERAGHRPALRVIGEIG